VRQILRLLLAESRAASPDWGAAVDTVLPGTGGAH
jgi:hypothetical protein